MIEVLAVLFAMSQAATPQTSRTAPEQPSFDDRPSFVVSGVTDYTYRGGHGSDTVLRSTEALAAATASLKDEPTKSSGGASSAQREHAKAETDEKQGDPLLAVREYERAAELDGSEANLFDWGTELLTHRAAGPAVEVFTKGHRLFPDSIRMLLGLATSLYMRGEYDRAAQFFFQASDLRPADPTPYLFLGRTQSNAIVQSPEYLEKLARFASLDPNNAWANYYYAAALWKRMNGADPGVSVEVRGLCRTAVALDPHLAQAFLLLGILDAGGKNWQSAISEYRRAIDANPELEEAHYRLSQVYAITGNKQESRRELETYKQLSKQAAEQSERERKEVQQFVYTLNEKPH